MTVKRVETRIKSAVKDAHISGAEAKKIVDAAEKNVKGKKDGVANTEAKKIGDLYDSAVKIRGGSTNHIGMNPPAPRPEHPHLDAEADKTFNQFFVRNSLPFGDNADAIKRKVAFTAERVERGDPLPRTPKVATLHAIELHDQRPVDGDKLEAFYDAKKDRFFLKSTGIDRRAGGEKTNWYGPFDVQPMFSVNPPHF